MSKKREVDLIKAVGLIAADFLASEQSKFANPYAVDRMRLLLDESKKDVWYPDLTSREKRP